MSKLKQKVKKALKQSKELLTVTSKEVIVPVMDISEEVLDDGYLDIMDDKTVVIFTMGGTSVEKAQTGSSCSESLNAEEICELVPEIRDFCNVEVVNFACLPSAAITPEMMLNLSKQIQETLRRKEVSGVVVTHGTDTLEETAYFVSISLSDEFQNECNKPIVFTGSMCGGSTVGFDDQRNLLASVRVACHDVVENIPQVVVCMNNEIHAASRVQKNHTVGSAVFSSPGWGPVGFVDDDSVYFRAGAMNLDMGFNFPTPDSLSAKVSVVKAVSGDDGSLIKYLLRQDVQGIVIEGFGRGNLPPTMATVVKEAIDAGKIVVISTRVPTGRVLDSSDFDGSVKDMIQAGAILGGESTSAKCRLLLIYLLSQENAQKLRSEDPELYRAYLQECFDPVLSERLFSWKYEEK